MNKAKQASGFEGSVDGQSFLQDVTGVFGSRIFMLLASLATGILLARQLGPEGKGIFAAVLVFPRLCIGFAEMGVRQTTVYNIGRKEHPESDIVSVALFFLAVFSLLGMIACAIVYHFVGNPAFSLAMMALALLLIPSKMTASYARGVFLGKQDISSFNVTRWLDSLTCLVGVILFVWLMRLHVVGGVLSVVLGSATVAMYGVMVMARHTSLRIRFLPHLTVKMLKLGVVFAAAYFVNNLSHSICIVMLERLGTTADIGQFSVGMGVAERLREIPAALGIVIFARSAGAADPKSFSLRICRVARMVFAASLLGAVVFAVAAEYAVPLLYGKEYGPSVRMLQLLLPGVAALTVFKVLASDLSGRGRPGIIVLVFLPMVILNVLLCALWIPRYGGNGAAVASSISYCIGVAVFAVAYSRLADVPLGEMFLCRVADFRSVYKQVIKLIFGKKKRSPKPEGEQPSHE